MALLQAYKGKLEKLSLQKLLFLVCEKQKTPSYEFIPYLFGCYSYSAKADLNTMVQKGLLIDDEFSYMKKDSKNYLALLEDDDRRLINQTFILYQKFDGNSLMKHTYRNFPYFAINSITAKHLLTEREFKKVQEYQFRSKETIMYTIGYEGISLESYLNKLIQNDIRVLIDVRNNPISQKFGFSSSQLKRFCESIKIEYFNFRDVGIASDYRQELKTQEDYDKLFDNYWKKTLSKTISTQHKILELVKKHGRIALTCFEADICQCHRKHLAQAVTDLPDWKYKLIHL